MFLAYIDESGDGTRILHTAVLIPATRWTSCLRAWLTWRKTLNSKYHVPASFELHASPFLHGKFEPLPAFRADDGNVQLPAVNNRQGVQREVIESSIKAAGRMAGAQILTCHQVGTDRMASYRQLLEELATFLEEESSHALLMVDGLDVGHRDEHRRLDIKTRRILEDPWMHDSRDSQFIQVADLVAHAAYHRAAQLPQKAALWGWYENWLADNLIFRPGATAGIVGL